MKFGYQEGIAIGFDDKERLEMALWRLHDILNEHKGKDNAITSAEIACELGISEDATHAITRSLIFQAIERFCLPVAATVKGYYIVATKEEEDEYITNLASRISGIQKRMDVFKKNCEHRTFVMSLRPFQETKKKSKKK